MLLYASVIFLVFGVALAKDPNAIKPECTKLNETIDLKSDQHVLLNCQTNWTSISIPIDGGVFTDGGLSLEIMSVTNFADPKALKIYAVSDNGTEKLIYEGLPKLTKIWMVTGQKKIRIEAKNEKASTITLKVELQCGGTFDLPSFVSPLLPNQPLSDATPVTCNFKFTKAAVIDFTKFSLANTSEARFNGTSEDGLAGPFSDKGPDHIVIVQPNSFLSLKLDLTKADQNVSFNRQIISGSADCGGKQMKNVDASGLPVEVKGSPNESELTCTWLIAAPEGHKLTLSVTNDTLQHVDDIASVVDGGNFTGAPLLQVTALNRKSSLVISSGRYLVVTLDSKDFDAKEAFAFKVSAVSSGGHLYNNGSMLIKESGTFTLSTSDEESLVVSFSALMKLNDSQKLVVLADSVEIVTFDAAKLPFDLSSPGSELQIVATGFSETGVSVPFTSKPKGSGCLRTFTSAQENGMRLIGSCNGECTWIIKPNVPAGVSGMFMRVLPNNVPKASISHLRDKEGEISIANSAEPFMISYQVSDGAWIVFDCSNAKDFEMSYVTKSTNQPAVTAMSGRNFTLTSPFFPGIYPQGVMFKYNVSVPDKTISYLAMFHIMDLLKPHTLSFGIKDVVKEFSGSDLPGDVLIPATSLVNTTFDTISISQTNPKGGYGFHISLSPASSSQTMTDASKTISTGAKCNDLRCVYIIDLPKPADVNASVSVNLTVTIPKDGSLKDADLLVWDGDSVLRNQLIAPIANLTKGGMFASRSNKLIVVYQGGLNLTLSYVASPCSFNMNSMCLRDRLCMPLSWRCDKKPHCSDGSDEWDCTNGHPPTPQPDPAPTSSSGWKVAFWLFMPLFILLGVALDKGVPMLIQRLRDSRYQQFHDLGDH